jgi:phospholipase/carboxylesterase
MDWIRFSRGSRLDPIAGGLPDAIVVLLHDLGDSTETMLSAAARWATAVPTTAFVAFDCIEQLDPPLLGRQRHTMLDLDAGAEPVALDRLAGCLAPLIAEQQRSWGLDASRLVLVGFREGGTAALDLVLRYGWSCAGVLAFSPRLTQPLPRIIAIGAKIRLIGSVETRHVSHAELRGAVASLAARGVDARGVVLNGSALSEEVIRYGGAYLVELIATAQRLLDREALNEQ